MLEKPVEHLIESGYGNAYLNISCQVASFDISNERGCPDGQVQISYWEKLNCTGERLAMDIVVEVLVELCGRRAGL